MLLTPLLVYRPAGVVGFPFCCHPRRDSILWRRVARSFTSATYQPRLLWCRHNVTENLKYFLTVHRWHNMFLQHALLGASLPAPRCFQKGINILGKIYIAMPNPPKTYFLDLFLVGIVNIRHKKWGSILYPNLWRPFSRNWNSSIRGSS